MFIMSIYVLFITEPACNDIIETFYFIKIDCES